MGMIIGSLVLWALAGGLFYGSVGAAEPIPLFLFGVGVAISAIMMLLHGLRAFFVDHLVSEMKKISGSVQPGK